MKLHILIFVSALVVMSGCTTPIGYTEKPLARYDRDTTYRVDDMEDGFTLTVFYSRYQFYPETDALIQTGKNALTSIAYEVADARGETIKLINEQRIKMSMGRNELTGVSSWTGTVRIFYEGPE